jgi:hypothetical protein
MVSVNSLRCYLARVSLQWTSLADDYGSAQNRRKRAAPGIFSVSTSEKCFFLTYLALLPCYWMPFPGVLRPVKSIARAACVVEGLPMSNNALKRIHKLQLSRGFRKCQFCHILTNSSFQKETIPWSEQHQECLHQVLQISMISTSFRQSWALAKCLFLAFPGPYARSWALEGLYHETLPKIAFSLIAAIFWFDEMPFNRIPAAFSAF